MFNSRSLAYLRGKGLESACVSFELRFAQIRDLKKVLPAEAIVYGRLPLMITENCLVQNETGCRLDRQGPAFRRTAPAAAAAHVLRDRTGAAFPLLPAYGHRTEVQNSRPLYLADRPELPAELGLSFARLRFTTETAEACVGHRAEVPGRRTGRRRGPSPGGSASGAWSEGRPYRAGNLPVSGNGLRPPFSFQSC